MSDNIALGVILTAGPNDSYWRRRQRRLQRPRTPGFVVTGSSSMTTTQPMFYLPLILGRLRNDIWDGVEQHQRRSGAATQPRHRPAVW